MEGQAIAAGWTRLGGLKQFGYPISQPFTKASKDDGKTYLVQYFERQRLEYRSENIATAYEVLLGRLGAEQVAKAPQRRRQSYRVSVTKVDARRSTVSTD